MPEGFILGNEADGFELLGMDGTIIPAPGLDVSCRDLGHREASRRRKAGQAAGEQNGQRDGTVKKDSAPGRTQPTRRVSRSPLTPEEWNAKFNASPIMRQVNPPDTLVDAWR
jgi:hypothetical protein